MYNRKDFSCYDEFNASDYRTRYDLKASDRPQKLLKCYHDVFKSLPSGLKILDYGTGPIILSTISAANKASEIVLSDYAEINRTALRQWIDGESTSLDFWSPHFNFVVRELEGKDECEVKGRQEQVRKLVKAVVHCDVTRDPPIERGYEQPYDVVISSLVLEAVSQNNNEYEAHVNRLSNLVKPGGLILLNTLDRQEDDFYMVGDKKFKCFIASADFKMCALEKAGFAEIEVVSKYEWQDDATDENKCYTFLKGMKS